MKDFALLVTTIIFSVFLCEVGLRLFTPFPITEQSNKSDDPVLGYRLSTHLDDVDQNGFRNKPMKKYDIAAIGDSHTYGNNVSSEQTWPSLLGEMTGMEVYNFGVGSYGLFTYHAILKSMINPAARSVIIGLYPANDFEMSNSFCRINSVENVFWKNEIELLALKLPPVELYNKICSKKEARNSFSKFKNRVFGNSAIISALKILVINKIKQRLDNKNRDNGKYFVFPDNINPISKIRTRNHSKKMNMQNLQVNYMFDNLDKFAGSWTQWARENKANVGVLLIPSMERVVYEYFNRKSQLGLLDEAFIDDLEIQIQFEKELSGLFDIHNIPYKFALNDIVDAFTLSQNAGEEFYPIHDGHPNEKGYKAYARAAYELWVDMNNTR